MPSGVTGMVLPSASPTPCQSSTALRARALAKTSALASSLVPSFRAATAGSAAHRMGWVRAGLYHAARLRRARLQAPQAGRRGWFRGWWAWASFNVGAANLENCPVPILPDSVWKSAAKQPILSRSGDVLWLVDGHATAR